MNDASPTRQQKWSADSYNRDARFVSDLAGPVLEWLALQPGERVLDLGCGDGVLTQYLHDNGAQVTGVDLSDSLLAAARERGLNLRILDGEKLDYSGEFDAVFSNAALHWMTGADAVIKGVWHALKPGGRFVAEFGGHGNVAAIVTAMRAVCKTHNGNATLAGPWFFPSPEIYQSMLEKQGFIVKRIGLFPRPTPLKAGMAAWLKLFRAPFFDQFGDERDNVLAEVTELLRPSLCDDEGKWSADYVRLRVEAQKP